MRLRATTPVRGCCSPSMQSTTEAGSAEFGGQLVGTWRLLCEFPKGLYKDSSPKVRLAVSYLYDRLAQ